jgi:hypothetical protein
MRGGTSKGVFFRLQDLPVEAQASGPVRDALLMRVVGSPDPYQKQIDGMGNGTSSTSKAVIVSKSDQPGHDVDYLFGQVGIDRAFVDWSGNCGNLTTAVGAFAISSGLMSPDRVPDEGEATVRIWQANIGKTINARIQMRGGQVQETGDFKLDGVAFPAAEVRLEFVDPADGEGALFPTGNPVDDLDVPGLGTLRVTMITAGIPTIFVDADAVGYRGTELQDDINSDLQALSMFEAIRSHGAMRMGLIKNLSDAENRQHTPKIALVARPASYTASSGEQIAVDQIDLLVRGLSMGKLHHAMPGTVAVAIGAASAVPGTVVNLAAGGGNQGSVRFGHPSGTLQVGAEASQKAGEWVIEKAMMSRSARVLMEGWVRVPGDFDK